ncbi:hypothetical protein HY629_01685 [Candidatus Uhrbacteria bacterium]|nr:hypothetical protein [Candidatus Uhrbacteria bacterium]
MIRLAQVMTRRDWVRLCIVLVFAVGAFTWVWVEWQKPIFPLEAHINF